MKKLIMTMMIMMMINIIMNKYRHESKARKVMADFKFDALYRSVFIESLKKSG